MVITFHNIFMNGVDTSDLFVWILSPEWQAVVWGNNAGIDEVCINSLLVFISG